MNRPWFTKPVPLGLQQPEPILVTVLDVWGDFPEPPAGGQRPSPTALLLLRLAQAVGILRGGIQERVLERAPTREVSASS